MWAVTSGNPNPRAKDSAAASPGGRVSFYAAPDRHSLACTGGRDAGAGEAICVKLLLPSLKGAEFMQIGELAKGAGVNVQTLRFYEREGLLPRPARTRSGSRDFTARDLARVRFIRSCQEIGFTLNDVREIFDLHRVLASPERAESLKPSAQKKFLAAAERRLDLIDTKLKLLRRMKKEMSGLIGTLKHHRKPVCPVSGVEVL
jgi:DNA-binding transcriptional MerR regulator